MPAPAASRGAAGETTPSSSSPKASGKNTSRLPNRSPTARGNIRGTSATTVTATTLGAIAEPNRIASDRATHPRPATAAPAHATNITADGTEATSAMTWATTGGYE